MSWTKRTVILAAFPVLAMMATAEDIPVRNICGVANQDSRFEIFAIASDGNLYHRWQNPERTEWSPWALNASGKFSNLRLSRGFRDRVFVSALDSGHLIVRSQVAPNSAFGAETMRSGHDLRAIDASLNQDIRMEVLAIGSDGFLYSTNENSPGSNDWSDWHSLGGHDLMGGKAAPTGALAPFIETTNGLAVVRDGNGRLTAFALGGDGSMYTVQQIDPNGNAGWGAWTSLQGHDLQEINAVLDGEGKITIFAQGADSWLYSRTQSIAGGGWREWKRVFSETITSWSATNRNGQVEVAAISSGNLKHRIQDLVGTWSQPEADIPMPSQAKWPLVGQPSLVATVKRGVEIFVMDSRKDVYALGRAPNSQWDGSNWQWLGSPNVSPNDPDIVAQALGCLGDDINQTLRNEVPRFISSSVKGSAFAELASNVSIATVCDSDVETIGLWLGRQPTPEVLHGLQLTGDPRKPGEIYVFAYRVTIAGINRVVTAQWNGLPKRWNSTSGHPDPNGDIELQNMDFNLKSPNALRLALHGKVKSAVDVTIAVDSTFAAKAGLATCDGTLDVSATDLGAAAQFFIPIPYGLGFYDELQQLVNKAEMRLQPKAVLVCKISDAFVSTILIPHKPDEPGPRKAVSIGYDDMNVDPQTGLTAYSTIGGRPQIRDRMPRTAWRFVISSARRDQPNKVTLGLAADGWDLRGPTYHWVAASANAVVEDKGGIATGQLVAVTFAIPATAQLKGLNLGDMTVTATDLDGQSVQSKRQVILDDFVLDQPPVVYTQPPKISRPAPP
jgi:hypothetical protein